LFCNTYICDLNLHSFPTRRSSDLILSYFRQLGDHEFTGLAGAEINMDKQSLTNLYGEGGPSDYIKVVQGYRKENITGYSDVIKRSEEHTSELQSRENLVCRLLLEK